MMKMTKKQSRRNRRGFILTVTIVMIVLLSLMGLGMLKAGLGARTQAAWTTAQISAAAAADCGLTKTLFEMNQQLEAGPINESDLLGTTSGVLSNSAANFTVTLSGSIDSGYTITSIGRCGRAQKPVTCALRLQGVWDYAILTSESIKIYTGTVIDAYDSSDPYNTDVPVQIATTSTDEGSISLSGDATVDGEVLLGAEGYFPKVTAPALPDMSTGIYTKASTLTIGPENSGKYTSIEALMGASPGILEISGGDVVLHVTGDMTLGNSCELIIRPDSSLTIYLEGDLVAGNSSGIDNQTEVPKNFIVYGIGEDQTFDLKAKSSWYGCIYAPEADITIRAGADVYGSFISANFELKAGGLIYYDAALSNVTTTDVAVRFVQGRWQED